MSLTAIYFLCSVFSVFSPQVSSSSLIGTLTFIGTIVVAGSLLSEDKINREAYGLLGTHWKETFFVCATFLFLLFLRIFLVAFFAGEVDEYFLLFGNSKFWSFLLSGFLGYFISFSSVFGEEYGWRGFLQPILQKKLGLIKGVLLTGLLWGLWHAPLNFFYYTSPEQGLISLGQQIITCVTLGIFFAYAYMKTNNIWCPAILHFMNNLFSSAVGAAQPETPIHEALLWSDLLPFTLISVLLFGGFLFTKYFRSKKYLLPTIDERIHLATQQLAETEKTDIIPK